MEARIRKIQAILDNAEGSEAAAGDIAEVGTVVTIRDDDGTETEVLLAPQENTIPGMVLASPSRTLGGALLGAHVGSTVSYQAPSGMFNVHILAVKPYTG